MSPRRVPSNAEIFEIFSADSANCGDALENYILENAMKFWI
jgi:hypothetical protein